MGIEAAIIGSAILGAGASMAGASKASKAQKQATQAQTQAADQNIALQREIYQDQRGLHQPYYQAGLRGLSGPGGVMDLMGMNPPQTQPQAQGQAMPGMTNAFAGMGGQFAGGQSGPDYGAYLQANPDVAAQAAQALRTPHLRNMGITTPEQFAEYHYNTHGRSEGRQLPPAAPQAQAQGGGVPGMVDTGGGAMGQGGYSGATSVTGASPGSASGTASEYVDPRTQSLRQTPGYQFQMDEARRGVENSFASRGKLLSGSAMKALSDRSQGLADNTYQTSLSNAFNVANLGTGAATNIAGAGQNYAANAGNAFNNIGNAQANGAIGQANAWNAGAQGVAGSIAGGIGMYGGYKGWGGTGTTPGGGGVNLQSGGGGKFPGGAPSSGYTYNGIFR